MSDPSLNDTPSMNTVQAAAYLTQVARRRFTPSTLRTYRCRNQGPAFYRSVNGKTVLYRPVDLDVYAQMQRVEPQPETRPA